MNKSAECLTFKGNGPGCSTCSIFINGFCGRMVDILEKIIKGKSLSGLPPEVIEDIASETIAAINKQAINFQEKSEHHFERHVRKIVSNIKATYFREKYKKGMPSYDDHSFDLESIIEDKEAISNFEKVESEIDAKKFISILETIDDTDCAKFILDYYKELNEGLSQKKMAEKHNMKENTFNQKLNRYSTKLLKLEIIKKTFKDYIDTDILELPLRYIFDQGKVLMRDDDNKRWNIIVELNSKKVTVILKDDYIPENVKIEKGMILHNLTLIKKIANELYVKLGSIT